MAGHRGKGGLLSVVGVILETADNSTHTYTLDGYIPGGRLPTLGQRPHTTLSAAQTHTEQLFVRAPLDFLCPAFERPPASVSTTPCGRPSTGCVVWNGSQLDAATQAQVVARLLSPDFDAWSVAAARVGFCAKPIRLVGRSDTFDRGTGEMVRSYASTDEPTGVTFVRCGNRRADQCESCSRLYAADTFHLIGPESPAAKVYPRRCRRTRWCSRP